MNREHNKTVMAGITTLAATVAVAVMPLASSATMSTNEGYNEKNLVSDVVSNAIHLDPSLLNPWGLVVEKNLVWINDNHSGLSVAYDALGKKKKKLNVNTPDGGVGAPTGLAFNDTAQFQITVGSKTAPAVFLMATEDGTITAWNPSCGTNAIVVVNRTNLDANYKGLAIASDAGGVPHLYAAEFHSQQVDEFDGQFNFVRSFTDTNLPSAYAPFNVRTIRGRVFVTYAFKASPDEEDDQAGPGHGFVDIFDTDGTLLRQFAAQGVLNSPWGLAVAPKSFGIFSHALLVGNFGDGRINAFDLLTGKWLGHFNTSDGNPLVIDGLWALTFEKDEVSGRESDFKAQNLYFTAGPNGEDDGVFGILRPISPSLPPAR